METQLIEWKAIVLGACIAIVGVVVLPPVLSLFNLSGGWYTTEYVIIFAAAGVFIFLVSGYAAAALAPTSEKLNAAIAGAVAILPAIIALVQNPIEIAANFRIPYADLPWYAASIFGAVVFCTFLGGAIRSLEMKAREYEDSF